MLGVAGVPAVVQFVLMLSLPESPRWLYRQVRGVKFLSIEISNQATALTLFVFYQNRVSEAREILNKIYQENEVEEEMNALEASIEQEKAEERAIGSDMISKVKSAWGNTVVRRGLYAGITVQVAQQFVGINTVMYYSPSILQLAGFASNKTALALSLVTSGINALGSLVSMCCVDRYGRRRLMLISMFGIIACLVILSGLFYQASTHSPGVSMSESTHFGLNSTCPRFLKSAGASWDCMSCIDAPADCGFCDNAANKVAT